MAGQLGLIGLGLLGSALAQRFLAAGYQVCGFDPQPAAGSRLAALGGISVADPRQVFDTCDEIVLSLPHSGVVRAVLFPDGMPLVRRGMLVVDTTTGSPEESESFGHALEKLGADYVDATVAGSSAEARRGEVIVMTGGPENARQRAEPILQTFARQTFAIGEWGAGARMKLVVNLALGLHRAVLAEALEFARSQGLDAALALEVLKSGPAASYVMETKGPRMLDRDFEPQARLAQHLKDVRLILETAGQTGARVPLSTLHETLLAKLVESGLGELDNSAVIAAFAPMQRGDITG